MWNVRKSLTSVQKTAGDYQRRNALSRATATFQLVERTARQLPIDRSYERGRVGIFNRSYYDEVLIVRVHPEILQHEQLPESVVDADTIWAERYQSIVDSGAISSGTARASSSSSCICRRNARLIVSEIILDVLRGLHMSYPAPTAERLAELQ